VLALDAPTWRGTQRTPGANGCGAPATLQIKVVGAASARGFGSRREGARKRGDTCRNSQSIVLERRGDTGNAASVVTINVHGVSHHGVPLSVSGPSAGQAIARWLIFGGYRIVSGAIAIRFLW
jgi:hypothetical protein